MSLLDRPPSGDGGYEERDGGDQEGSQNGMSPNSHVATAATRWMVTIDVHYKIIHHLAMVATGKTMVATRKAMDGYLNIDSIP